MKQSKIKLLPHVLVRLGGMSYDLIKELEFSKATIEQIEMLSTLELEFLKYQADLVEILKGYASNYIHFKLIRKLKKVIRKGQFVTVTLFQVIDEVVVSKLLIYNELLSNKKELKITLESFFEKVNLEKQEQLQSISKAINLQQALPLSSIVFSKQYLKYLDKSPSHFHKKEQQVQQKIFQFLTRTAAKVSPFSSFTPVCYGQIEKVENNCFFDTSGIDLKLKKQLEWNNYLLEIFKSTFIEHNEILPFLKIDLNATIKSKEQEYEFLINQQNIEKFQKLEKQPILEIFENILLSQIDLSINELVDEILEEVAAEKEEIIDFIKQLIDIGFLEIHFSFNQKSSIWLEELINFSGELPLLKKFGIPVFQKMLLHLEQFKSASINERIKILENSFIEIQQLLKHLGNDINITDFKTAISPEQMIYEDTAYEGLMKIDGSKTEVLVEQLNGLLSSLNFIKGKERLQIKEFFDLNYSENDVVSVLDFYENYHKNGKNQLENEKVESIISEGVVLKGWAKAVEELLIQKYQNDGEIILNLSDFQKINNQLNIQPESLKGAALCCFVQLFESNEKQYGVLNAVSLGFGKMTGRFLDLMPNDFYENLKHFNKNGSKKILKVENTDASFFNANNHPLLLDYELVVDRKVNQHSEKEQISIVDLSIKSCGESLIIWHNKLKKQVMIFDLGIQAPKGRSPLYQFLQNFSPVVPTLYYLEIAIERFVKRLNLKNQFSPSIYFENWVLKRKTWTIGNLGKLKKVGDFSNLEAYQNWLEWRFENDFFDKSYFIKKAEKEDNQPSRKRKPVYINFHNFHALNNHFYERDLTSESLQIQEMQPNENALLKISNSNYTAEFVLHWYNL